MLESCTATIATLLPALTSRSNNVSHFRTGFSYFLMPWTAGGWPVNMVEKHTGVTGGTTDFIGTTIAASYATGRMMSGNASQRCKADGVRRIEEYPVALFDTKRSGPRHDGRKRILKRRCPDFNPHESADGLRNAANRLMRHLSLADPT
jgi:hypothetical protein